MKRILATILMVLFAVMPALADEKADIQVDAIILNGMIGQTDQPSKVRFKKSVEEVLEKYSYLTKQAATRFVRLKEKFAGAKENDLLEASQHTHLRKAVYRLKQKYPNAISEMAKEKKKAKKQEKKALKKKKKQEKKVKKSKKKSSKKVKAKKSSKKKMKKAKEVKKELMAPKQNFGPRTKK